MNSLTFSQKSIPDMLPILISVITAFISGCPARKDKADSAVANMPASSKPYSLKSTTSAKNSLIRFSSSTKRNEYIPLSNPLISLISARISPHRPDTSHTPPRTAPRNGQCQPPEHRQSSDFSAVHIPHHPLRIPFSRIRF